MLCWRTFYAFRHSGLSFMIWMKDISLVHGSCFVFHRPDEGHFVVSRPAFCPSLPWWRTFRCFTARVLSFIISMKDISGVLALRFVFHHHNEGHFANSRHAFCPSSPWWRTFHWSLALVLSFITTMKDISLFHGTRFVLHHTGRTNATSSFVLQPNRTFKSFLTMLVSRSCRR